MFDSSSPQPHNRAAAERQGTSARPVRTFTHRSIALAAAALVAASLSVALPLQDQAASPLDGHGTSIHHDTAQASLNADGDSAASSFVTKGQKG